MFIIFLALIAIILLIPTKVNKDDKMSKLGYTRDYLGKEYEAYLAGDEKAKYYIKDGEEAKTYDEIIKSL